MVYKLYWIREDRQGDYHMGDFPTEAEAKAAIKPAGEELLDQCGEEFQREEILRGTFEILQSEDA